ncbi:MAG: class I SAM-dependent methyltransferase [Melioribacteraceae bacterium]|nr:MAG: class I SAM-dependent methyltransferase [Melioribacteraceae bacterium]
MAKKQYYEQIEYTNSYLLPFFINNLPEFKKMKVLEVGCAEAGFLRVLKDMGMETLGIELDENRAKMAVDENPGLQIIVGDITDDKLVEKINDQFDLVVMREVIEHVPNKEKAFANLNKLTKEGGYMFMSFPPKYSGFAGHQQLGRTFLKFTPYIHLLPEFITRTIVKILNEHSNFVEHIKHNYGTGITINHFEKLCNKYNFVPVKKSLYLFRPIYKFRFGLPTVPFADIPLVREFLAFGCETVLKKE